ncbi:hypothetical protein PIB30_078121 [Stylosanthes scabra]|uniref:Uncharacterized protein n=1 Tax=Stylosanthes scabra TaxID=79078 RepID=A0ABU6SR48_9FABA|nr:hypothetical protein [Stylosanthes scabra]
MHTQAQSQHRFNKSSIQLEYTTLIATSIPRYPDNVAATKDSNCAKNGKTRKEPEIKETSKRRKKNSTCNYGGQRWDNGRVDCDVQGSPGLTEAERLYTEEAQSWGSDGSGASSSALGEGRDRGEKQQWHQWHHQRWTKKRRQRRKGVGGSSMARIEDEEGGMIGKLERENTASVAMHQRWVLDGERQRRRHWTMGGRSGGSFNGVAVIGGLVSVAAMGRCNGGGVSGLGGVVYRENTEGEH